MRLKSVALAVLLTMGAGMANADPSVWKFEWPNTDFEMTTIENWREIMSGGPPRDGIPALTNPKYVSADEAGFMNEDERVLGVVHTPKGAVFLTVVGQVPV